jgi:predicted GIY-YIG superfamily endonuclease
MQPIKLAKLFYQKNNTENYQSINSYVEKHFIYVIAANPSGPVKLGISNNPEKRVRQLQTGHADTLYVFHKEPVEQERVKIFERLLHRDNRHMRLRGEWFNMSVEHAISYVLFTIIQYELIPVDVLQRQFS